MHACMHVCMCFGGVGGGQGTTANGTYAFHRWKKSRRATFIPVASPPVVTHHQTVTRLSFRHFFRALDPAVPNRKLGRRFWLGVIEILPRCRTAATMYAKVPPPRSAAPTRVGRSTHHAPSVLQSFSAFLIPLSNVKGIHLLTPPPPPHLVLVDEVYYLVQVEPPSSRTVARMR